MPLPPTEQGSAPAQINKKDNDGNEINFWGKFAAGAGLIILVFLSSIGIIAYWPDRLPDKDERYAPLYVNEMFHIRLACVPDTPCCADFVYYAGELPDSLKKSGADTTAMADSVSTDSSSVQIKNSTPQFLRRDDKLIHINTLLLILVALGGFLGNMIHIATSFTTFVGAGKFKSSWVLWYCVKPFTASALAIAIYFVFRGGFLNMSDGGASINLYGLMTISIFAGLFTDKATEKLKEVFEVVFRAKEERPDPLSGKFKINSISPLIIERDKENTITITGEKLDTEKLAISVNGEAITNAQVSVSAISFLYKIPASQTGAADFTVIVTDEKGKEHYKAVLTAKDSSGDILPPEDVDTDEQGLG